MQVELRRTCLLPFAAWLFRETKHSLNAVGPIPAVAKNSHRRNEEEEEEEEQYWWWRNFREGRNGNPRQREKQINWKEKSDPGSHRWTHIEKWKKEREKKVITQLENGEEKVCLGGIEAKTAERNKIKGWKYKNSFSLRTGCRLLKHSKDPFFKVCYGQLPPAHTHAHTHPPTHTKT